MAKGPLCVLGCYILWGLLPIFWKQLAAVDSLYVLGSRILWAVVFTVVLLALRRGGFAGARAVFRDRREWLRLTLSGCVICVNWGTFIWAVNNGHMLDSSLAYYMNPILAILIGTLVFRERLTRMQWLAVAAAFTGIVIAILRYRKFPWIALVIGGSFAVYGALKKTVRTDALTSLFVETLMLSPVFLVLLVWMELAGRGAVHVLHGWQWLLLPVAGVLTTVPLILFSSGMKTTSMTVSGILMFVNPTLQLMISVWLYHEEFTTTHAILFAFVWGGLALYLVSGRIGRGKHKKEEHPCA